MKTEAATIYGGGSSHAGKFDYIELTDVERSAEILLFSMLPPPILQALQYEKRRANSARTFFKIQNRMANGCQGRG